MPHGPHARTHRAEIDAAWERCVATVSDHVADAVPRLRRALSLEGRARMCRASAKTELILRMSAGASGDATLESMASESEPLLLAAALGAAAGREPAAALALHRAARTARTALPHWLEANAPPGRRRTRAAIGDVACRGRVAPTR